MNKKPIGYIYRIFKPTLLTVGRDGQPHQLSYIGRTTTSIEKRFREHKRAAINWRASSQANGDGKLHANMSANDPETFQIEEIYKAYSEQELSQLEEEAIHRFDSITFGWNKIKASATSQDSDLKVCVDLNGQIQEFSSIAELCRSLGISNSTLTYQVRRNGKSLAQAVEHCLTMHPQAKSIVVFRKRYKSINDAIRDKRLNRHNLSKAVLSKRIASGMAYEEAFSKEPLRSATRAFKVLAPDGVVHEFSTIADGYRSLSMHFKLPSYTSVQQCIRKGQTVEQAFGFSKKPWEQAYAESERLIQTSGYRLVGEKKHSSIPLIAHKTKEIFASARELAKSYNFSYYGVVDDIKEGLSADQIIEKRSY